MIPCEARFFYEMADLLSSHSVIFVPDENPSSWYDPACSIYLEGPCLTTFESYIWPILGENDIRWAERDFRELCVAAAEAYDFESLQLNQLQEKECSLWNLMLRIFNRYGAFLEPIRNEDERLSKPKYKIAIQLGGDAETRQESYEMDQLNPELCLHMAEELTKKNKVSLDFLDLLGALR